MSKQKYDVLSRILILSLAGLALSATTGCGKTAFKVTESSENQQAPGSFLVQPKVDILLAEDDTGSMAEAYPQVAQQVPAFLTNLEAKGWNYHFATIPLTWTTNPSQAIDQMLASKHDGNWNALNQWVSPYPGASPSDPGSLSSSVFRTIDNYSGFITASQINNSLNGQEPGLEAIRLALANRVGGTGFLRSDALLVVVVVGNGDDTSGVTYCKRSDGFVGPCELVGFPQLGTMASSLSYYQQQLSAAKPSRSQIRFYAAVAATRSASCVGGTSFVGARYQAMAQYFGGTSPDICTQSVSSVLDGIAANLQTTRIQFRTRYLFMSQQPDPATITVTRYSNGVASTIPQDPTNGWTYAGHVDGVYTIDSPTPMNLASGYAVELHGTAKLIGDDTATVNFKPFGATDAAK